MTRMRLHPVKISPSRVLPRREDRLAWKIAGVATDAVPLPEAAAGIGTLPGLTREVVFQALHTSISFRRSRKGEISSWKAHARAHAGKLAVEALLDRCMPGEGAPGPVYEGKRAIRKRWPLAAAS